MKNVRQFSILVFHCGMARSLSVMLALLKYRPEGRHLTQLSQFGFKLLPSKITSFRTHYIFLNIPQALKESLPFGNLPTPASENGSQTSHSVSNSRALCEDTSLDALGAPIGRMARCAE